MLSQALDIQVNPAKINGNIRIYHATFRQPRSESAVSILSLKKTPLFGLDARPPNMLVIVFLCLYGIILGLFSKSKSIFSFWQRQRMFRFVKYLLFVYSTFQINVIFVIYQSILKIRIILLDLLFCDKIFVKITLSIKMIKVKI